MRLRKPPVTGFYLALALVLAATISSVIFGGRRAQREPVTAAVEPAPGYDRIASGASIEALPGATGFDAAAAENTRLRSEVEWAFGGKAQHGWSIYAPLIAELIGTDQDSGSGQFAAALAQWQRSERITPSGTLDNNTLSRMISVWQSRRMKDHTVASPSQLLTAPASDFYDPSRADELRKVEPQTYAAYKRLVTAAIEDPSLGLSSSGNGELAPSEQSLKIVSAYRSPQYQEQLRKQSPGAGSAGLAKNSAHFTGRALDLYVGGDPVSTDDHNRQIQTGTKVYRWLVRNADKFGFDPYFYEPWHWEYRGR